MTLWIDPAVCQMGILAVAVIAAVVAFRIYAPKRRDL